MITIGRPRIINMSKKSRLESEINIDGKSNIIWFEVDEKYEKYLCYERSDAFVIAILNYAMRNGHDITCLAPMGEDLYYQITTYLIDAVYKGSKKLHNTIINTDIDSSILITAHAVGTGISCGIDSFHVLSHHTHTRLKKHNITHLAFNNVGSHGEADRALKLYDERKKLVENFAKEYEFELVDSNSNIHDVFPQNHLLTHTYTSTFAIYALQKLYSIYYYASSDSFFEFSLKDNADKGTGFYDLLLTSMFSNRSLIIYSEGGTLSRLEKTKRVAEYTPSYKYLNVCTVTNENCNKCEKCIRTLLALDALEKLDLYKEVFDINYYKSHRQEYYARMMIYVVKKNQNHIELYALLKNKVSLKAKIIGIIVQPTIYIVILYVPKILKPTLKKIYYFFKNIQ